jgi:hypothetical protein
MKVFNFPKIRRRGALIWMTAAIIGVSWTPRIASADTPDESASSTTYRLEFDSESAPSGIRFMIFIQNQATDDPDLFEFKERELSSVDFREEDLPLLKIYFMDLHRQIEQEIESSHRLIACDAAAAALTGERLGALWNSFDDIRFAVYAKYFGIANAEMAKLGYSDFAGQLKDIQSHFGVISFEYRASAVDRWQEMQDHRARLCANWAQSAHP